MQLPQDKIVRFSKIMLHRRPSVVHLSTSASPTPTFNSSFRVGIGEQRTITKLEKTQTKIFQLSQLLVRGEGVDYRSDASERSSKRGSSCTGSHWLPGVQMDLMPDEWLLKASLFSSSSPDLS
ncbi:hypothetical protein CDAR_517221 [Caerostris darwini]|uniref:Uncharacterized protein n=1 Tax=Caerostris darwini TaxID=1538125 RepID=A0AAV4S4R4_9ARAC|nr:hypothetical protein CDAR_517221 [Caerostris darwini]